MVIPLSGETVSPLRAFAFGKLPTHGDFVMRGLSAEERDAWDVWASEGLERAKAEFGESFEDRHDAAPPVRFAFGPGPFGDGWKAGAITPSIDGAGRRFVIVVGARSADGLSPEGLGDQVAGAAEEEIYHAFQSSFGIDDLLISAQDAFDKLSSDDSAAAEGRFWSVDTPLEVLASQPPADLLVRALSL